MEDPNNIFKTQANQCIEFDQNIKEGLIDNNDITEANCFLQLNKNGLSNCKENIIDAFKILDKEGRGIVSYSNLFYLLSLFDQSVNKEDLNSLLEGFNIDGDGYINYLNYAS